MSSSSKALPENKSLGINLLVRSKLDLDKNLLNNLRSLPNRRSGSANNLNRRRSRNKPKQGIMYCRT